MPFEKIKLELISKFRWDAPKPPIPPITPPERVNYKDIWIQKNGDKWEFTHLAVNYSLATLEEAKQVIDELLKPPFIPSKSVYRGIEITNSSIETYEFNYNDSHYILKTLQEAIELIDQLLGSPEIIDEWGRTGAYIENYKGFKIYKSFAGIEDLEENTFYYVKEFLQVFWNPKGLNTLKNFLDNV